MPAPSPLAIATSSVQRLLKEEKSYQTELEQQQARVTKLEQAGEGSDENAEYQLRQEKRAIDETKAIFPQLRERIGKALGTLQQQLEAAGSDGSGGDEEEINRAKEAVGQATRGA